jgi:hypothetical protein
MTDYAPEDFARTYQIIVQVPDVAPGMIVGVSWVGELANMGTYDVDPERVAGFERVAHMPFSFLLVPDGCELIVVE